MKIKTIDVNALEWFDKINGNSYFAGTVTVNYGTKTEKSFNMPYQYGYGDMYKQIAMETLVNESVIKVEKYPYGGYPPLWQYCSDNGIILRTVKHENCKKRELLNI